MKTVAFYFGNPDALGAPLDSPLYFESYKQFSEICGQNEIEMVIVRGDSYKGSMTFSEYYTFQNETVIKSEKEVTADLIFVKDTKIYAQLGENDHAINKKVINDFSSDKWLTYQDFGHRMAFTAIITNENWQEVVSEIETEKIVLKPRTGCGGDGIIIVDKKNLDFPKLNLTTPYIAQEFVDSSAGIPGIMKGSHDLRVITSGGHPLLSYIRMPKEGSLLSNFSQGANGLALQADQVPESVVEIVNEVDEHFKNLGPRFYTIDFMLQDGIPYICEINSQPGFPHAKYEGEEFVKRYHATLLRVIQEALTA